MRTKCKGSKGYHRCILGIPAVRKARERREAREAITGFLFRIFVTIIGFSLMVSYFLFLKLGIAENIFFLIIGIILTPIGLIIFVIGFIALMNFLVKR